MKLNFNIVKEILDAVDMSRFLLEINDDYTRNILVSRLTDVILYLYPDMADDVKIICDESLNTPELIDANSLRFSLTSEDVTVFVTMTPQGYIDLSIDLPIDIASGITK